MNKTDIVIQKLLAILRQQHERIVRLEHVIGIPTIEEAERKEKMESLTEVLDKFKAEQEKEDKLKDATIKKHRPEIPYGISANTANFSDDFGTVVYADDVETAEDKPEHEEDA